MGAPSPPAATASGARPPPRPQAERTAAGKLLSGPVVTMALTLALSAAGVVPVEAAPYDVVWRWLVPLSTSLYLLESDLSSLWGAGRPALGAFLLGAAGTVAGLAVAWPAFGGAARLGAEGWKVACALTASYVGGSVNFAATADALGLASRPLAAAAFAADNVVMAAYLAAAAVLPVPAGEQAAFGGGAGGDGGGAGGGGGAGAGAAVTEGSVLRAVAAAALSCAAGRALAGALGLPVAAGALAALSAAALGAAGARVGPGDGAAFRGAAALGAAAMQVLFAVIGASAGSLAALAATPWLLALVAAQVAVHAAVTVGVGAGLLRMPLPVLIVASNANIGGPATAVATAAARGWPRLVPAASLTGSLGYAIGTAVGLSAGPLITGAG